MPHHLLTTDPGTCVRKKLNWPVGQFRLNSKSEILAGISILVVEDEYLIALEAQRMIEEAGAEQVVLANSIGEVRKLLVDGPRIDVVVLDLKLGEDDASPLIGEFVGRKIPLLVTTGFDVAAPLEVPCLAKPYREAELVDAISQLVQPK
jgi:DNA-binding NtrC family response regulator